MEVLSPWSFFARKIQIIFVNRKQLILMGSKDAKLIETWVWDRSLSMNCRGFCLGQHRETINFTVSLPARTNWWFKGGKKNPLMSEQKYFPACLAFKKALSFFGIDLHSVSGLFSWQPPSVVCLQPDANRAKSHQYLEHPEKRFWVQTGTPSAILPSETCFSWKQRHGVEVWGCHYMLPTPLPRSFTSCPWNSATILKV